MPRSSFATRLLPAALCAALLLQAADARADRRSFLETYEYMTMPDGDLELELWNRHFRQELAAETARAYQLEIEVEYGITNHWDIAVYQDFSQSTDPVDPTLNQPFQFDRTKVESRYRLGERGSNPIDMVLYFEVAKRFGEDEVELEPKFIAARDFGKLTVALNAAAEVEVANELEASGDYELEAAFIPAWAFGVTYELQPSLKIGAETYGEVGSFLDGNEVEAFAGPSLSWAPSPKLWVAGTVAFGLTSDSTDLASGFIVGLSL